MYVSENLIYTCPKIRYDKYLTYRKKIFSSEAEHSYILRVARSASNATRPRLDFFFSVSTVLIKAWAP